MNEHAWIGTGATGSAVAAVCCFTPVLAIGLPALGLAAWLGWIDYVLFPALGFFAALTAYGLYRLKLRPAEAAICCEPGAPRPTGRNP